MKILIDVDEEIYQELLEEEYIFREIATYDEPHSLWNWICIYALDGVHLSDNATNGDIIKAVFPNCQVVGNHNKYEINNGINETASYIIVRFGNTEVEFNAAWWGSLYKCELPIKLTLVTRLRHLHRPTHPSPNTVLHFQQT